MPHDIIKNIILGIIQGLTEFLPVSSSGHLVIFQEILNLKQQTLLLNIILHCATTLAVIVFFKKDIIELSKEIKLIGYILIVTIITGVIGILGKDFFESLFVSVQCIWLPLFVTGVILLTTKNYLKGKRTLATLNFTDAVFLGVAQGLAIIPGISRSGVTISLLLFLGIKKEETFRFSFLSSIPAVLGALFLEARGLNTLDVTQITTFLIGFAVAFLSGLFALSILKKIIHAARFSIFGYYCLFISFVVWFLFRQHPFHL